MRRAEARRLSQEERRKVGGPVWLLACELGVLSEPEALDCLAALRNQPRSPATIAETQGIAPELALEALEALEVVGLASYWARDWWAITDRGKAVWERLRPLIGGDR